MWLTASVILFCAWPVTDPMTKPLASLRCSVISARRGWSVEPLTRLLEKFDGTRTVR